MISINSMSPTEAKINFDGLNKNYITNINYNKIREFYNQNIIQ